MENSSIPELAPKIWQCICCVYINGNTLHPAFSKPIGVRLAGHMASRDSWLVIHERILSWVSISIPYAMVFYERHKTNVYRLNDSRKWFGFNYTLPKLVRYTFEEIV
jgi:hypothetical protein